MMKSHTLKIKKPFGQTLTITLLILLVLFAALEFLLRADFVQPYLLRLIPSLGGKHLQLEEQLARLEHVAAFEGKVDCIFLGSSLVWLGFNPPTFEEVYKQETGEEIHCVNLGIETLPANAASDVAEVVMEKYQPWLLIYGTSARDYAISRDAEDSRVVWETPWLQYQLGHHTLRTGLVSNSYVIRYMKALGNFIKIDEDTWSSIRNNSPVSRGFLAKTTPAQPVHFEAAAQDAAQWFQPFHILPENLAGLAHIVGEQGEGTQVIVVEMPVNSQYFSYFSQGQVDYDRFATEVSTLLTTEGITFLRPLAVDLIPENGWWDRSHMNLQGADIFSQWMAEQIARLVAEGELEAPSAYLKGTGE
jgi:hypothetical protein